MLSLDIEFLSGVCYAASERDGSTAEYPPQADRVYSALVAAWAARGEDPGERAALEWLERQAPPRISASGHHRRTSVDVFVPPNDDRTGRDGNVRLLPAQRRRQPRRFPAALPFDPVTRLEWEADPDAQTFAALVAIASDVVYVGHSASLVRARFGHGGEPSPDGVLTRRAPYDGRLAELERAFRRGERPARGAIVTDRDPGPADQPLVHGPYRRDWIVLPGIAPEEGNRDDFVPDARACVFVTKRLRDALMSAFGARHAPVPEWISGHHADGTPTERPHLAIVPMLDVGHRYATGNLMGLALVAPTGTIDADEVLIRALLALRSTNADDARPQIALRFDRGRWRLALTDDDTRSTLDPGPYAPRHGARRWATVTPIVLDRHPKSRRAEDRTEEIKDIVAASIARSGLPPPRQVVVDKHAAFTGCISAAPSNGAPSWTRWSMTAAFANRPLTHAVIEFAEPVGGPILLGAGRYYGLGLCRPMEAYDAG